MKIWALVKNCNQTQKCIALIEIVCKLILVISECFCISLVFPLDNDNLYVLKISLKSFQTHLNPDKWRFLPKSNIILETSLSNY